MRLIDGDALIALVQDSTILGDGFKQAFCALVNGEPTIEPERTGKWIGYAGTIGAECSVCHKWLDVIQGTAEMNYCPNCGARMEQ